MRRVLVFVLLLLAALALSQVSDTRTQELEIAKLKAELAAAEAKIQTLKEELSSREWAVETAEGAVQTAHAMTWAILGVVGLIVGLTYAKLGTEDRDKIREAVEAKLLPELRRATEEHLEVAFEELRTTHLRFYYSTLTDFYTFQLKNHYDRNEIGWSVHYAIHALTAAYRGQRTQALPHMLVSLRPLLTDGIDAYKAVLEEYGASDTELDVIAFLAENIEGEDLRVSLRSLQEYANEILNRDLVGWDPRVFTVPKG